MFLAYCLGNSSAAVVPGGAAASEVLEGLCEGEDGLSVGLAIEKVRVEGWRDGMVSMYVRIYIDHVCKMC